MVGGLGVWLFGRGVIYIGVSGMVYGYFGFLVLVGFKSKKIKYFVIFVLVVVFYGGMLVGIFLIFKFIFFEYYLFGFIGGLIVVWYWV